MTQILSMDETGIIKIGPVLTAATIIAIEKRMILQATAAMIARQAGMALIKPRPHKIIPYVGWAIAIGVTLYAGYEAYKSFEINYRKLENDIYDEQDMATFRMGYTEANLRFADTVAGARATREKRKYILIPAEVMPVIAAVDTIVWSSMVMFSAGTLLVVQQGVLRRQVVEDPLGRSLFPTGTLFEAVGKSTHLPRPVARLPVLMSTVLPREKIGFKGDLYVQRLWFRNLNRVILFSSIFWVNH
jgi:hypothetical protein